jgi:hypothetical protein
MAHGLSGALDATGGSDRKLAEVLSSVGAARTMHVAALEVRVERRLTPQTPVTANKPVIGSPAVGDPEV